MITNVDLEDVFFENVIYNPFWVSFTFIWLLSSMKYLPTRPKEGLIIELKLSEGCEVTQYLLDLNRDDSLTDK